RLSYFILLVLITVSIPPSPPYKRALTRQIEPIGHACRSRLPFAELSSVTKKSQPIPPLTWIIFTPFSTSSPVPTKVVTRPSQRPHPAFTGVTAASAVIVTTAITSAAVTSLYIFVAPYERLIRCRLAQHRRRGSRRISPFQLLRSAPWLTG